MSGRVVHFEIPVDDLSRAGSFYREAFGWTTTPMPDMDYATVQTTATDRTGRPTEPGAINGGMLTRRVPITHPVVTLTVEDIDAALREVERLGGRTVLGKQQVGTMGFAAYFADTEGNVVGMWEAAH